MIKIDFKKFSRDHMWFGWWYRQKPIHYWSDEEGWEYTKDNWCRWKPFVSMDWVRTEYKRRLAIEKRSQLYPITDGVKIGTVTVLYSAGEPFKNVYNRDCHRD